MAVTYAPIDLGSIAAGSGGFVMHGEDSYDRSGRSVASAGDINGDGLDDLIIGALGADGAGNAKSQAGGSYVVFGKAGGFGAAIDLASIAVGGGGFVIHGEGKNDLSGWSVASAGDVNGDGFDDLIIGAPDADGAGNTKPSAGGSYLVFGKAGRFPEAVNLAAVAEGRGGFVIHGEESDDLSGFSVASAGDVNGDGFADLIIGAPQADGAGDAKANAGGSYVVFGKAGGFSAAMDLAAISAGSGGFVIHGEGAKDASGVSVASAGDVNGDGFSDLIIGAPQADGAGDAKANAGGSYVVFGKAGGFSAAMDLAAISAGSGGFVIHGEGAKDASGASVASAGDVNGDGFADLIIGAPAADRAGNAKAAAGGSYLVFGKAGGFAAAVNLAAIAAGTGGFVIYGEDPDDISGQSVASAGDLNGDGFDDLIIGAPRADGAGNAESNAGDTYVVFGKASGWAAEIDLAQIALGIGGLVIHGEDEIDWSGRSVASAGDIDGDGFDDLAIGAQYAHGAGNTKPSAGSSYVIFGGTFLPGPTGTEGADAVTGGKAAEGITGLAGNDLLLGRSGNDTLSGGDGRDRLKGGEGADALSGGQSADRFVFGAADLGSTDRILDFDDADRDRIVLRGIDAIATTVEDDAFIVIGTAAFSSIAGELRWGDIGRGVQRIEGDVDGDGAADLVIDVANDAAPVSESWLVL